MCIHVYRQGAYVCSHTITGHFHLLYCTLLQAVWVITSESTKATFAFILDPYTVFVIIFLVMFLCSVKITLFGQNVSGLACVKSLKARTQTIL